MGSKIGFIGLGQMGSRMCKRLLFAGHSVSTYDLSRERVEQMGTLGAAMAANPKEASAEAEFIFLSLPDSAAVESAVLGAGGVVEGARAGAVVIDTTSAKPLSTRKVAAELKKIGVEMLDAPVSRGVRGAEMGTLSMMVGGATDLLERCKPVMSLLATDIYHVGGIGAGHILKMLNNFVSATCFLITTEAIALGTKAGLDPRVVNSVINSSSGQSYATEKRFPDLVFTNKLNSGFSIKLMQKDVAMALDLAQSLMVPTPIGAQTVQAYTQAMAEGLGERDNLHLVEKMEQLAGVKVR